MYEFSIPGGGFVSLEHMVEVLGIARIDENTVDSGENEANETEDAPENDVFNGVEETGVEDIDANGSNYEESISLNNVEVSEATKKFVADVASVEFSNSELVWVGKADSMTTVGQLKDVNGLEIQYSADLSEEQITEINHSTVEAGDWALISMLPFDSQEVLTVTMKKGEYFEIRVTDYQISTHVITADGEDYIITVSYDDSAKIPAGAVLEAEEIIRGTDKYEECIAKTLEAVSDEPLQGSDESSPQDPEQDGDNAEPANPAEYEGADDNGGMETGTIESLSIDFARFFDIRIMAGGEKIEPEALVKVTVTYADMLQMSEGNKLLAVHFGDNGTEVTEQRNLVHDVQRK